MMLGSSKFSDELGHRSALLSDVYCAQTYIYAHERSKYFGNREEVAMGRLDGKVALISGGARGQGATEAKLFVREGAKVVFGDIRDEEGRQVEAEIRAAGGEATYVHLDVTRDDDWR